LVWSVTKPRIVNVCEKASCDRKKRIKKVDNLFIS
jgi:hypothetical protein